MMYLVICTVMVIITVLILKDTHVTVYYNGYSRSVALIEEDYDLKVPVWLVLVILILGFIPVLNIMLYTVGYLFYIVHAVSLSILIILFSITIIMEEIIVKS